MTKKSYLYDPKRMTLVVYEDGKMVGGYVGHIAERKLLKVLLTDDEIKLTCTVPHVKGIAK